MNKNGRPDWVPDNPGKTFACHVRKGVSNSPEKKILQDPANQGGRRKHSTDELVEGVLAGNRTLLAKAITLIESSAAKHFEQAQDVLNKLIPHAGKSIRVGITGVPGVGKSTFIEALGLQLCEQGYKVAVLAIDPSSSLSKGSILGDKTRMEKLARHPNAFIRPSPSSGTLGGVANKTRETILACEAFGCDTVLVETVGVGQSEVTVRSLVDYYMLLLLPGAGDELQGIKKGVVELTDGLVVNKADGDFEKPAQLAHSQYANVLQFFTPATPGWSPSVTTCSSLKGNGIEDIWDNITSFANTTQESGVFDKRRKAQAIDWIHTLVDDHLKSHFYRNAKVQSEIPVLEKAVLEDKISPAHAARSLLEIFGNRD